MPRYLKYCPPMAFADRGAPPPRAVFFDLDQTLIQHSEAMTTIAERELRRITAGSAVRTAEFNAALFSAATKHWQNVGEATQPGDCVLRRILSAALLAAELNPALAPELLEAILRATAESSTPTRDAHECLFELRNLGVSIGIITNGFTCCKATRRALTSFSMPSTRSQPARRPAHKPKGKIFELALRRLNVPASQAWYVGDRMSAGPMRRAW
jgi:FMN phosphatase YigB (HAD superfamily)